MTNLKSPRGHELVKGFIRELHCIFPFFWAVNFFFALPLPFFSGFFFLPSSLGGGLLAASAGELETAGPEGSEGFEQHSTFIWPEGMATSRTAAKKQPRCL